MTGYQYTECGLDNVCLEKMDIEQHQDGEETVSIPRLGELHRVIAEGIISAPYIITGKEVRFLRTEMGLNQGGLADALKVERLTVSRWERGENPINDAAEMALRMLVAKRLFIARMTDIEAVTDMEVSIAGEQPIRIDGSDPREDHLLAA